MAVAVAWGLRQALEVWSGPGMPAYITFYPMVMAVAILAGFGPGAVATVLAGGAAVYCFIPPVGQFSVGSPVDAMALEIFIAMGLFVSGIAGIDRRNRDKAAANERKAALRASHEALRDSLKDMDDIRAALDEHAIVATTDAQGRITFVNDKFCSISKYTREELLGQDHRVINSGFHPKEFFRTMWTSISQGHVWHGEVKNLTKDGSFYWVDTTIVPFLNDDGTPRKYLAIRTDITERKGAEEALRESKELLRWAEESFRLMVESVSDCAIIMLDPQGHIVSWNSGAERIKGYRAEEIVGQHFSQFHLPDDVDSGKPQWELDVAKASGQCEASGWRVRKDGTTFWANVVFTAVRDQAGNLRGFAKLTRDLTESRRQDQLLRDKNMELEKAWFAADNANRAKSDFLSNMSHELRTPLNGILGFAQLIDTGAPEPTPNQKRCLDQILKGGWYLLELINDILDLAQIESGKLSLSLEPVLLRDILRDCQSLTEPLAQKRHISMAFSHRELPPVAVDRTRVKQVLLNLLSNAIKYNTAEGSVAVECLLTPPGFVRISVRDTGRGMHPEQLAQLFQPFNRLGKEVGTEVGTGIGLVVTKRLVELMGGVVGVESTVGVGSVFWVDLPLATAPPARVENEHAAQIRLPDATGLPQRTLLYVEDNPANIALVEQLVLRRADLHLLSAGDGHLGIAYARSMLPDVILMDIHLPGINGLEAMQILRADPQTKHIPIIAVSANAMPNDMETALAAGFFMYLTKPFKIRHFMEALDLALARVDAEAQSARPPQP
jgi:PAS domain S-box-containing protein